MAIPAMRRSRSRHEEIGADSPFEKNKAAGYVKRASTRFGRAKTRPRPLRSPGIRRLKIKLDAIICDQLGIPRMK